MGAYIRIFEDKWRAIHSIKAIKKTEREKLAAALLDYGCLGVEPSGLSNIAQGMFDAIKTSLAPSGRGAPMGNQNARKDNSENNSKTIIENNSENNSVNNSEKNKKNNSVQNTEYRIQNTETDTPISPKGNYSAAFEKFWEAYPKSRHVGKQKAFKVFDKAIKNKVTTLDAILTKLEQFKNCDQWKKNNGEFIPHPTTWLNRGSWDDEVVESEAEDEEPEQEYHPIVPMEKCKVCGSRNISTKGLYANCLDCQCSFTWRSRTGEWKEDA